jgi:hypothetical protein
VASVTQVASAATLLTTDDNSSVTCAYQVLRAHGEPSSAKKCRQQIVFTFALEVGMIRLARRNPESLRNIRAKGQKDAKSLVTVRFRLPSNWADEGIPSSHDLVLG